MPRLYRVLQEERSIFWEVMVSVIISTKVYSHAGGKAILGAKSELLYSEIALTRKLFGIGHIHIYNFLLKMTDTMNFQNIDLSSWDTLRGQMRRISLS
jgi:hypothetical protein